MAEAIGSVVVGVIVTALIKFWIDGLTKKLEKMGEKIDVMHDFVTTQKERNRQWEEDADEHDRILHDHEDRIHILEQFKDRVKIYHKRHHDEDI